MSLKQIHYSQIFINLEVENFILEIIIITFNVIDNISC